jgi:hypothetical protein
MDALFIVLTIVFFVAGVGYVIACDRLGSGD